ncbi:hypothetical protein [Burkholderia sp. LMG 32019]|uniref:hypothetical protein n=1 Tax=Burkholderia sp. LMG 32019 TaxID=3158173 RepID=UPI003C2E5EC8
MNQRLLLIIGNGFTIDFLKHFDYHEKIDTSNLFRYGADVPWPGDGSPGFLSYKYCPCLWNLGARPSMDTKEASDLIEEIITCANVYGSAAFSSKQVNDRNNPKNIYINAYFELLLYLRHLFVYYNNKIKSFNPTKLDEWSWFAFLNAAYRSKKYQEITIVTYNYDIWLERVLTERNIPFYIEGFQPKIHGAIAIIKPHGSISFCHEAEVPKSSFYEIKERDLGDINAPTSDFLVKYTDLDQIYPVTPLIPPAGNAQRFELELTEPKVRSAGSEPSFAPPAGHGASIGTTDLTQFMVDEATVVEEYGPAVPRSTAETVREPASAKSWASDIRQRAREAARNLSKNDELIISGLSYWHVDRDEIDSLLVRVQSSVEVKMINPSIPRSLNAVLTSLFKNYRLYPSARIITELSR